MIWVDKYFGEVDDANGKKHGRGIFIKSKGNLCQGIWNQDKLHGTAIKISKTGDCFTGFYRDGVKQYGLHKPVNGPTYQG